VPLQLEVSWYMSNGRITRNAYGTALRQRTEI